MYLFEDERLGGTNFFTPTSSLAETEVLVHDSSTLSNEAFTQKTGIPRGYCVDSNAYFERVGTVPAKWNRMIFYDGGIFHSGNIRDFKKLSSNPANGRLTLNGFFTCAKRSA